MDPTTAKQIQNVINTLNTITVNGRDNLSHLLACIYTLEKLIAPQPVDLPTGGDEA